MAHGLERVPQRWRRKTQWLLVVSALVFAVAADRLSESPIGSVSIYVLAALPGLLAFLIWRSLLASAFVSLVPGYFVIGELTEAWPRHAPELALDRLVPMQPAWVFVYASLYVFIGFLPLLVIRQRELFRRALKAYLFVMIVAYAGFLLYPVVAYVAYVLFLRGCPREAIAESDRRRAPVRALYAVGIFGFMVSVFWVGSKL